LAVLHEHMQPGSFSQVGTSGMATFPLSTNMLRDADFPCFFCPFLGGAAEEAEGIVCLLAVVGHGMGGILAI
jgi:hypothetical protein